MVGWNWIKFAKSDQRSQKSAGKVLASIVWDEHSIIFIDYLVKEKTVIGECYATLFDSLNNEINKRIWHMSKKTVFFH